MYQITEILCYIHQSFLIVLHEKHIWLLDPLECYLPCLTKNHAASLFDPLARAPPRAAALAARPRLLRDAATDGHGFWFFVRQLWLFAPLAESFRMSAFSPEIDSLSVALWRFEVLCFCSKINISDYNNVTKTFTFDQIVEE